MEMLLVWGGRAAIRDIEKRMEALETAWESQKRDPKLLRTEWESTLDKMNSVLGRLNARIRATAAPESEKVEQPEPELSPEPRLGTHGQLAAARARRGW